MMPAPTITLRNGRQNVQFKAVPGGYRPAWFHLAGRPMLRFKDHEFLNIGGVRVTTGELLVHAADVAVFGGEVAFAGVRVEWLVRVATPTDGGPGFTVTTELVPLQEPIELLEAMTTFELPYEYDGNEELMTVITQQPVYRCVGGKEVNGAGYVHPFWYYGRTGRAHLTYPSASPLLVNRIRAADGSNERCTMFIGNWNVTSVKDLFAQPTRGLGQGPAEIPFPEPRLRVAPGRRGLKFLVGAVNWNASLHKDPNVLVEAGVGLHQEVTVDFAGKLPEGRWDGWLADGWERLALIHFPNDGHVPAWEVAKSRGASWVAAADWLTAQLREPAGCPGFFNPDHGPYVYAPNTRPKWDTGVELFAGQWTGPVAYLGHLWRDPETTAAADRLERLFAHDHGHRPEDIWTIGPTPMYCAVLRKARLCGVADATLAKIADYIQRRAQVVLNPPATGRRGDSGILAWDAFANLLAADLLDRPARQAAARELLARVNAQLDERWWAFNCAAEGDLVGMGGGRPFGHGIAIGANMLAWQQFGEEQYRAAALRFANTMLAMHYITYNESPTPDLDTRGWAHGSTGGRDQWAQLPPWETSFALQQLAPLMVADAARNGCYDVCWLFAHTGLAMFPRARTMKRLYQPDRSVVYRPLEHLASERAFYLSLPYLAYENPWDQTMLACYQGVEPLILSLFLGGGLARATDDRVAALVPQAAAYEADVATAFRVQLWNPLTEPVETALEVPIAVRRGETWRARGEVRGTVMPEAPVTSKFVVPPRQVVEVELTVAP